MHSSHAMRSGDGKNVRARQPLNEPFVNPSAAELKPNETEPASETLRERQKVPRYVADKQAATTDSHILATGVGTFRLVPNSVCQRGRSPRLLPKIVHNETRYVRLEVLFHELVVQGMYLIGLGCCPVGEGH